MVRPADHHARRGRCRQGRGNHPFPEQLHGGRQEILPEGQVAFWCRVSSETSFDYLRFYVDGVQGFALSGESGRVQQVIPISAGTHTLRWEYTKDGSVSGGQDTAWVDQVTVLPSLAGALDQPTWTFATSGGAPWYGQTAVSMDGVAAAQAGGHHALASHRLRLLGELRLQEELSFWYKVSSEQGYDFLRFYVDGTPVLATSGEVPWTQFTWVLGAGPHTLRWDYSKDTVVSVGSDTAWVDYIDFTDGVPGTAARPDFNGDRMADIVWRQASSGALSVWLMNGRIPGGRRAALHRPPGVGPGRDDRFHG